MSSLSINEVLHILRAVFRAGDGFIAEYLKEETKESREVFKNDVTRSGPKGGKKNGKVANEKGNDSDAGEEHEHDAKRKSDLQ